MDIAAAAASSAQTQSTDNKDRAKLADQFDNFLSLLTTQLQYQDPLSPTDSTEFTNQLVQFTQVEQMIAQTEKLDALLEVQNGNALQSALGMIGLDALVKDNYIDYGGDGSLKLGYKLPQTSVVAGLQIVDEGGQSIRLINGPTQEGQHTVNWDGHDKDGNQVPPGTYRLKVVALNSDGQEVVGQPLIPVTIDGFERTGTGETMLSAGSRQLSLDEIYAAYDR